VCFLCSWGLRPRLSIYNLRSLVDGEDSMKNVVKTSFGVLFVGFFLLGLQSFAYTQQLRDKPIIKKMSTYRGDVYPSFAEFRVQDVTFDEFGIMTILTYEPYDLLVNVDYITKVHRYEDQKKTDYSCLMYFKDKDLPLLVRMQYKEVTASIRRATEAKVK
jgi:hypothetical protein